MAKNSSKANTNKSTPKPAAVAAPPALASNSGWLQILIALVVTTACYWSSLDNELVNWDDDPNITENANLIRTGKNEPFSTTVSNIFDLEKGNVIGNYNPLPILTFALEKKWTDTDFANKEKMTRFVRQVHTDNLLLHLLVVFFAMRVLMLMGIGPWGALMGGLLMGIHPMRVESVAWATERKDVLFGAFFFASLECYIRYRKAEAASKRNLFFALSMALAVFSLFSKVQAVTLVVSMFVVDYWFRRNLTLRSIGEKTPLLLASVAMGIANIYTLNAQGSTNDDVTGFNLIDRACIATWSFSVYLYKLFIPEPMSPLYPYPKPLDWFIYASPVVFLGVAGLVYWLWKNNRREWVFGFLFFFLNVAPVLQFFGAGQGYLADRFTYVPYFGFFAIAAWLYHTYSQDANKKTLVNVGFGIVLLASAVLTIKQIGIWKNGETLWTHVMKYEYDKDTKKYTASLPFWNRGQYLRKKGESQKALADYSQAVEISPDNPELYNSRGKTYFDLVGGGKLDRAKAADYLQKALTDYDKSVSLSEKKPKTQAEALINRGAARGMANQYDLALMDLNKGVQLDPTNKNGYFNRSIVYYNLQKFDEAIADYTAYIALEPYDVNMLYERGMLFRVKNRLPESIADLSAAIKIKPDFGLAYLERARANGMSGNKAAAQADYQRATQYGAQMQAMDQQILAK